MTLKLIPNNDPRAIAIAGLFSAINSNDIAGAMEFFDPEVVRVEPEGFPNSGTYRGLAEMKAHFLQGRQNWAEGGCEPEEYLTAGERVVVFVHVHVRLKDHQDWIDARTADVFAFMGDKISEMRSFADRQEALDWAAKNS